MVKFSIITPCFKQPQWLRLCAASIADQADVEVEHIVRDGSPDPERAAVIEAVQDFSRLKLVQEADEGMYDAINRGLKSSQGGLCGYLNCDEQYLPGSLARVGDYFARHPEVEVVVGDALIIDPAGHYICHRQTLVPRLRHTVSCHLSAHSCSLFFRRNLLDRGFFFDTQFRAFGDADLVARWLKAGIKIGHLSSMLAVFTDTGANLGAAPQVMPEVDLLRAPYPQWWKWLSTVWSLHHRWRRWRANYYQPAPLSYSIYTLERPEARTEFHATQPTFLWKKRLNWLR